VDYTSLFTVVIKIGSVTGEEEKLGHMQLNGIIPLNSKSKLIPTGLLET